MTAAEKSMNKLALATILGVVLTACGQQAATDLAACKADLTKAQAETLAAKAAADAKIATLEQAQTALQAKVAEFETAAAAAASKVDAAKAKTTAYKQAVQKATTASDVKTAPPAPVKQMTAAERAKAAGF